MANELLPTQRGKRLKDDVVILVGGRVFDGWEDVSITKNLESIANEFSISLFDKFTGLKRNWPLKPGVSIRVNIGEERVITGRIEKLDVDYGKDSRSFSISGRSLPGDLVDCMHVGPCQYKDIQLAQLARELVRPFGLKVFESVVAKVIPLFAVKPGETVFEALDRAARAQGFFFISTRNGNIRLTRAAKARSFSGIEQDVNILSATANFDDSARHNEYTVKGQSAGLPDFHGPLAAQAEGKAQDLGIKRHRPLVLISESNADITKSKERAEWEASVRLAKGIQVQATVPGWLQANGVLWGINQVIRLKSEFLGINQDMLSTIVTHEDGKDDGKTTMITLTDKRAYLPEPVKAAEDDLLAALGAG